MAIFEITHMCIVIAGDAVEGGMPLFKFAGTMMSHIQPIRSESEKNGDIDTHVVPEHVG